MSDLSPSISKITKTVQALSVSRFNEIVRQRLQLLPELKGVWVEGELFNFVRHTSGHIYFSIKDQSSQLRCTFFKGANTHMQNLNLKNGSKILVWGQISVYHAKGEYQFNVQNILMAGEGALRLQIEELKKKMMQEGLFSFERKKKLPLLPFTLGIATAATGAAVKDIISVARHRYPNLNILLSPCQVQGASSAPSIIAALEALQRPEFKVDVIILGRGGGSFEDLLGFSDEHVLRSIAKSRIPIISAVGHEIDSPLSDLVADASAPTPTAAVEKAIPQIEVYEKWMIENNIRMQVALTSKTREAKENLNQIIQSPIFQEPLSLLQEQWQNIDQLQKNFSMSMRMRVKEALHQYDKQVPVFILQYKRAIEKNKQSFYLALERLENFSPLGTLKRGYAIVRDVKKKVVHSVKGLSLHQDIEILLDGGGVKAKITKLNTKPPI